MATSKNAQSPSQESLVDFDKPPINEVVCGVGFRHLDRFITPYVGLWWSEIQKDFPTARKADPIFGFAEKGTMPLFERATFVSKDETQMIQLQPTRFYYNWIKSQGEQPYPRYSRVYKRFFEWHSKFTNFLSTNDIGLINLLEYNLTYVNLIPQGQGWNNLKDIHRVLPDISWEKSRKRKYISEPADFNFRYVFPISEQPGRVTVTVQRGTRKTDQVPVLRFELAAQATVADGLPEHTERSMAQWFGAAREAIVLGFLDLTDEKVQIKYWGRRD
jgi:uncharacterized protein (TIGR04255 family)